MDRNMSFFIIFLFGLIVLLSDVLAEKEQGHTNNWAVLVCTSRFWFNYRHMANVLSLYRSVKHLGIPDNQIIMMLPDDMACNPRNKFPGEIFNNRNRETNVYGDNVEVDYRGYDVSVENFIRLMTGRTKDGTPYSKKLMTNEKSNILVYLTGHGGDEFIKFQDAEELTSIELADTFEQMHQKKRYNELLFIVDTCQANTLYKRFYSPNILAVGSSRLGESSWSHHDDPEIGISVIDRFTHDLLEVVEKQKADSKMILTDMFKTFTYAKLRSHYGIRTDLFERPINEVLLTDFFGQVPKVYSEKPEKGKDGPFASVSSFPSSEETIAPAGQKKAAAESRTVISENLLDTLQRQQKEKRTKKIGLLRTVLDFFST